ncbi:type VI secretion system baseplate subunit TssF/IglH [Francisella sp. SYW-9]|uniref:type VI secretion system baseplate subunit TssF/IglH n=1 Tax=Francisella sp. SYW-9 TaxID=2610888 RepID=UPI00123D5657|nr:type VI secretion system baseplate subunit TssF/IglH [Francisella sp. SYW-9]
MDTNLKEIQSKEQLYQYLESSKYNKNDILKSRDLKAIIDAVDYTVQRSTLSTQNFLLQRRFNLFYSYYPHFFQHIPNHAIVEISANQNDKFIDLELGEEFALNFDDNRFRFQAAIPFSLSPFEVINCYLDKSLLSIELDAIRPFRLDRNRFLLSCNPLALKNYQIYHLINALRQYKTAKMTLYSSQLEKPLSTSVALNFDIKLNLEVTQEAILRSLTQAVFSNFYVEFESLPEDYLFSKILLEIEVPKSNNIVKPLSGKSIKTNLLPVFNLFEDYAMKISCDYSQESYAVKHLDGPNEYVPTKLYEVQYNDDKAYHSYLNLSSAKSYNLMFEPSGHMRVAFLKPSLEDLSEEANEIVINAQWTQIASADIEKKNYTFLPLSRSIGSLKFNIIYSYGFKRNQLLERAENILKVLNVINATGLDVDLFNTLVSLITNHDIYAVDFIDKNLISIESDGQFSYAIYIRTDLSKSEFIFYADLVQKFLTNHFSRRIGIQINLKVKVK